MPIEGYLVDSKVVVLDKEVGIKLYKEGFYGKFTGLRKVKDFNVKDFLELSLMEALYLMEKGELKVKDFKEREVGYEELLRKAKETYPSFDEMYKVYRDLRERGYVVKSGMKFGATFAVYERGPGLDHAPFLVHVMPYGERVDPIDIVRAGRLSHSVRKRFVLASVEPSGEISYYVFSWFG